MSYAPRSLAQIFEKTPEKVKNFGIWFRYDSRTGTHNAYKEYREVALTDAVNSLCALPARHSVGGAAEPLHSLLGRVPGVLKRSNTPVLAAAAVQGHVRTAKGSCDCAFSCSGAAQYLRLHPVPYPNPNRPDQNRAGLSRAKAVSIQILRTSELKAPECKRPNITQFHVRTAPSQVAAPRLCPEPAHRALAPALGSTAPVGLGIPSPPPLDTAGPAGTSGNRLASLASETLQTHKKLALTPRLNFPLQTQKIKFPLPHRIIKTPKAYKTTFKASSSKTFFG